MRRGCSTPERETRPASRADREARPTPPSGAGARPRVAQQRRGAARSPELARVAASSRPSPHHAAAVSSSLRPKPIPRDVEECHRSVRQTAWWPATRRGQTTREPGGAKGAPRAAAHRHWRCASMTDDAANGPHRAIARAPPARAPARRRARRRRQKRVAASETLRRRSRDSANTANGQRRPTAGRPSVGILRCRAFPAAHCGHAPKIERQLIDGDSRVVGERLAAPTPRKRNAGTPRPMSCPAYTSSRVLTPSSRPLAFR